jgi:hypothetical protein
VSDGPTLRSKPINYDLDDLIALSNLVPRTAIHVLRMAAAAIVILLVATIVFEAWALTGMIDWPSLVAGLFVAILIFVISNRRFRAWMWLRLRKRSALYAPSLFELVPGAFRVSSSKLSSEIPWTTIRDVQQMDGRLFVFVTKRLAYIVPRRAFDTDQEFNAFVAAALDAWEQRHRL